MYLWLLFAAAAATEIGRVASLPMVAAACKVKGAALVSFLLLSPVANLLLIIRKVDSPHHKAVKEPDLESTADEALAEATREVLRSTLVRGIFVTMAFIQLKLIVDLWGSCVKGSDWARIYSVVRVVGDVGADATYCFVIIPYIAQMWRKKQPLI